MIYVKKDNYELRLGKMQEELKEFPDNSIDSIVTDPPYELNFMNKGWDNSGVAFQKETWEECLRVLKPGGYMLAFGGSRTFHRIACAIEDAGFEIRDTIMWLYGSGFPKSMNIGLAIDKKNGVESPVVGVKEHCKKDFKDGNLYAQDPANKNNTKCFGYGTEEIKEAQNEWKGWGTCLKPAFEPIIMARKPVDGTIVDNIEKYGVGGINIDECRVYTDDELKHGGTLGAMSGDDRDGKALGMFQQWTENTFVQNPNGRFPANVITDGSDEVAEGFPNTRGSDTKELGDVGYCFTDADRSKLPMAHGYNDVDSAMRYFYCAKASKKDRDEGCSALEDSYNAMSNQAQSELKKGNTDFEGIDKSNAINALNKVYKGKNTHPTVKPCDLMQYLVRLISPKGATILDPFMGSGSTGKATMIENVERNANYKFIGVEMTEEYLPIAEARIEFGINYKSDTSADVHPTKTPWKQKAEPKEELSDKVSLF